MSTTANRTRGAVPTRMAAAIAALSLLAMPVPAGAQGSGRTVLLTLTEGASLSQLADTVGSLGGRVLATLELSDSLLVELPIGVRAPAGSAEIPDTPMKVNGTQHVLQDDESRPTRDHRRTADSTARPGVTVALVDTGVAEADGLDGWCTWSTSTSLGAPDGDGLGPRHVPGRAHRRRAASSRALPRRPRCSTSRWPTAQGNTSLSKVLAGLRGGSRAGHVDVVNLSLSTDSPLPPSFDPLTRALDRLWAERSHGRGRRWQRRPRSGQRRSPGQRPRPAHGRCTR